MELLQCVPGTNPAHKRAYHSADREINGGGKQNFRSATLSGGERRISLPSGHHYTSTMSSEGRGTRNGSGFRHYGSSLSLAAEHGTHELTSRTLRPPSPTTLRKSSTNLPPSAGLAKSERSPKPSLPSMRVELESPKLADYLERPRLVNASLGHNFKRNEAVAAAASAHHAKRYENNVPSYRNLRLGNFMEAGNGGQEDEDIIPERLRQYYLDTYLNVCDTCESLTHCNPLSPIHRDYTEQ